METNIDKLFKDKKSTITDFNFGKETAKVFDDMLERSVPFYMEMQRMICEQALEFAVDGSNVYDLGCSTGTTLLLFDKVLPSGVRLIGFDDSSEMLQKAREKAVTIGASREIDFVVADLNKSVDIKNASVVVLNLTLQFVRPLQREKLVKQIAQGMLPNGCLLLVEKVLSEDSLFNRQFIKHYYEYKQRNGYSAMEISQKREALENVLVPYRTWENQELLKKSGFLSSEIFFKWYNFCGYIARKGA